MGEGGGGGLCQASLYLVHLPYLSNMDLTHHTIKFNFVLTLTFNAFSSFLLLVILRYIRLWNICAVFDILGLR